MKTIFVPVDFSQASVSASEYAAGLAHEMHAELVLFHAYHVPLPTTDAPIVSISQIEMQEINEEQLDKLKTHLKEKTGVEARRIACMGMAVPEILDAAKHADLIVMGMRGEDSLSEFFLGSTAVSVIRKAMVPVLVIPGNTTFKKPQKIGLACDYDPKQDRHDLEALKKLVGFFSSELLLLQVKPADESITVDEAVTGLHLEQELADLPHQFYLREGSDPVEGINQFVDDYQLDIMAVMPHHHSLIERIFHKSISKHLALRSHVPLLTLPEKN